MEGRASNALRQTLQDATTSQPIETTPSDRSVFSALAQVYGPSVLRQDFSEVRKELTDYGAVALVQRVLWGERAEDAWLAVRLLKARVAFETLYAARPDAFMREAQNRLQLVRSKPPSHGEGAGGDD